MQKIVLIIFTFLFLYASFSFADDGYNISGTLDLKKFADEILDIYKSDEVDVKKERLVYKSLTSLPAGLLTQ